MGLYDQDIRNVGIHGVRELRNVLGESFDRLQTVTEGLKNAGAETTGRLEQIPFRVEKTVDRSTILVDRAAGLLARATMLVARAMVLLAVFQFSRYVYKLLLADYRARRSVRRALVLGSLSCMFGLGSVKFMFSTFV